MAAYVKCYYCGKTFDREKTACVSIPGKRRYAHIECEANGDKETKELQELESYIKELFSYKTLPEPVRRQIKHYRSELNYSYSDILLSLIYHYEVRHGDKEKSFGRIGIVPYVKDEAIEYYEALRAAQEQNSNIDIDTYILPTFEVRITPPQRRTMTQKRRLFTFLEEDN